MAGGATEAKESKCRKQQSPINPGRLAKNQGKDSEYWIKYDEVDVKVWERKEASAIGAWWLSYWLEESSASLIDNLDILREFSGIFSWIMPILISLHLICINNYKAKHI